MNNHFTDVGPKLAGKIPKSNVSYTKYLGRPICNSIVLKETDSFEILSLISLLDPKKAVGHDGISCKTIKLLAYVISPVLSDIFNHALQHGKFPDSFKVAKVIPLHKGGKSNVVNNYRPISILSTLSKLFEKVIDKRLVDFFEKYNVISQHYCKILLSNTLSIIFMPCSSNFTPLYKPQFITSPFPLKIGTTTLVFHSFGIPFPSKTRWQSCNITSSAILPPATIISVVTSESPATFP